MFKKLRNRFLILNLLIISVVMLFSFASIYLVTYKSIYDDINAELHKVSEFYRKPGKSSVQLQPRTDLEYDVNPSLQRAASFSISTDEQWNIISIISLFDMDGELYLNSYKAVLSQDKGAGQFKLDDRHWAYVVQPIFGGYSITFIDITSQQSYLTNLVYTFLVAALVMLIIIFFISSFFANRSIKPVKEAFDKQKQFIADASHELKTPLAVINTNVDVLLSNNEDTIENQSKWLHYIKSECERMTKLTYDLLYLAQMDYSDTKMIFTGFNISEAIENAILTMEAVLYENQISLNYEIEPSLTVSGNKEQIRQVVMILLDNALKYTNPKGAIDISVKKRSNDIVLSVTNTGDGISEEHIERIFDRFYRTDKSRTRKYGGYGLGLAIAKVIVEQHNGRIYAKSILNKNTTFYVELPMTSNQ
ncbi:MAG: hypothetical protein K0R84_2640 [Clostridia bacterium]|jgi:signal transduction histidine kinase|nr:hypothetical protein [Clostridia bacterium]